MAYFDNAATTFPKPECVYSFMDEYYRNCGGSVGRGQYKMSKSALELVSETRSQLQTILHCESKQVVFTPTATLALNIIIQGLIKTGVKNIYISPFEHNAITRTLHAFEKDNIINVYVLNVSKNQQYDFDRIKYSFDENKPDLVIVSHVSNVIGLISPIADIFTLAKKYGAITLTDMAQSAGLVDCNIGLDVFDFAVFAGHKTLLGPTGISGFVMKQGFKLDSVLFGGTGFESANQDMPLSVPEKFEFGTLNISGIAGLNASLKWLQSKGISELFDEEIIKRKKLIDLLNGYDFINIIGNQPNCSYVGIVSCLVDGISSESAGEIFTSRGIAIRSGLHCSPLAHKFLGTYPSGTIRFSVNHFTNNNDFDELKTVLDFISDNM